MVELILILMLAGGIICLGLPRLQIYWEKFRYKVGALFSFMEEDNYITNLNPQTLYEKIFVHIGKLLQAAFFIGNKSAVTVFIIFSASVGVIVFTLTFNLLPMYFSVFIFAVACCLPYLMLLGQVQAKRVSSSMEGEILVTELLNNYKINYCNMRQAIEVTAMTIEQAPNSKRLLFNLAKGLNNAAEGKRLEKMIEEFRFAIGTSWAGILATNIYLSCQTGLKVTASLSDLAESMRRAREVEEFSKRENNESFLILKYLIPGCGVVMCAGAVLVFDMTFAQFINYQFRTSAGVTWFVVWLVSYMSAIAVNILLTKKKFDL